MKRLNIAMLSEQETMTDQVSENLDIQVLEINQAKSQIDSNQTVIDESKEISQSLDSTTKQIEQMDSIPEEVVKIAQEQIKYCIKRTGLNMDRVNASLENRGGKEVIIRELRLAKESLDKSIRIAQEGLWDKIKNKFDRVFTSRKGLAKEIDIASRNFDSKGRKEAVFHEKYLSVYLNPDNKTEATSDDVVKILSILDNVYNSEKAIKTLDKMIQTTDQVIDTVSKHNYNPAGDELSKLVRLQEEITKSQKEINDIFESGKLSKGIEASLVSCEADKKDKIIALCKGLLIDNASETRLRQLIEKTDRMFGVTESVVMRDSNGNYVGSAYKDSVNHISSDAYDLIWDTVEMIHGIEITIFNVVHSATRYIQMSTNK